MIKRRPTLLVAMDDDDRDRIGAGFSLSLITIFYGLIFILLLVYPFIN